MRGREYVRNATRNTPKTWRTHDVCPSLGRDDALTTLQVETLTRVQPPSCCLDPVLGTSELKNQWMQPNDPSHQTISGSKRTVSPTVATPELMWKRVT